VETFTFLFTDIEGSTVLLGRLGEGLYAQVLADHHVLIRSGLACHDGREVDTQGDAFFAVFSSPRACVAAVLEMPCASQPGTGTNLLSCSSGFLRQYVISLRDDVTTRACGRLSVRRHGPVLAARVHAPITAKSGTAGPVQSRVCDEADAEGALDGFCPPRTISTAGAWTLCAHPGDCGAQKRPGSLCFPRQPTGAGRRRSGA
jgi:hypothetical protein